MRSNPIDKRHSGCRLDEFKSSCAADLVEGSRVVRDTAMERLAPRSADTLGARQGPAVRLCGRLGTAYIEHQGENHMSVSHRIFRVIGFTLGLGLASVSLAQNVIADWHVVMESTVPATGRKNAVALPYFAYVDVAMYDAVNSIDGRFQPFAVNVYAPLGASKDAAAASAAYVAAAGAGVLPGIFTEAGLRLPEEFMHAEAHCATTGPER